MVCECIYLLFFCIMSYIRRENSIKASQNNSRGGKKDEKDFQKNKCLICGSFYDAGACSLRGRGLRDRQKAEAMPGRRLL